MIRTVSGLVFAVVVIACVFLSPWTCASFLLFVVAVGAWEMCRLHGIIDFQHVLLFEMMTIGAFLIGGLAALKVLPLCWLLLELPLLALPFLYALFSKRLRHETVFACGYAALSFLTMPTVMMLFMYREDLFGAMAGPWLIMLVFCLL